MAEENKPVVTGVVFQTIEPNVAPEDYPDATVVEEKVAPAADKKVASDNKENK